MQRADKRKFHYIYKITRTDGKFYIGLHSTDSLDDGYFGSGKRITRSIKKHGKEKHFKEILEFLPDRNSLKIREREIVNGALLADKQCLNIMVGGQGFDPRGAPENESMWKAIHENISKYWDDPENRRKQSEIKKQLHKNPKVLQNISDGTRLALSRAEVRANMSAAKKKNWEDQSYRKTQIEKQNIGKKTESFILKQRVAKLGELNPNFGTRWIHNETLRKSTRISKTSELPTGWAEGRKIYKHAAGVLK